MKKSIIAIAAVLAAGAAQAESSVTLYGLIDAGVTFVNNQGGDTNFKMDSGVMNGNRWGLRGREELNENLAAIFRVEGGFSLDNGNHGQGGKLFGRQAFAGLDIKDVGAVTFGRQYDFMDSIGDYTIAANQFGGVYALESSGAFHNDSGLGSRATGGRVDNSIKFTSTNYSGLSFGAMYGAGENAQDKKDGRVLSATVAYDGVPNLSTRVAFTEVRGGAFAFPLINANGVPVQLPAVAINKTRIYGAGASYDLGFGKVNGVFTMNNTDTAAGKFKANVYEAGYTHKLSPQLSAGIGYQYFDNRTDDAKKLDIHGASVALDYAFSKRTDLYALGVWNKAKSQEIIPGVNAHIAPDITGTGASDSKNQVAVRVGLRHRF